MASGQDSKLTYIQVLNTDEKYCFFIFFNIGLAGTKLCVTFVLSFKLYSIMSGDITFTMIKPDAVGGGHTGAILKIIEENGFEIKAIKKVKLTAERAGQFYAIHKDRPFYNDLCSYMSSGPIIPIILQKSNAVEDFRKLIGATDPSKADAGTIRALFAKSIEANAIHGSDSDENAIIESTFFFSQLEKF